MPIGNKLGRLALRRWVRPQDIKPALTTLDVGGTLSYAEAGGLIYPRNHRAGLMTKNGDPAAAGDQDHDISIQIGQCRDATDTVNITLETAITKRYDADWGEGTGAGGLAVGDAMEADHTFHVYLIKHTAAITAVTDAGGGDITCACSHLVTTNSRVTISGTKHYDGDYPVEAIVGGTSFDVTATFVDEIAPQTGTYEVVDAGFDDDTTATALLADSGYTYYRRVASFTTDADAGAESDILAYVQVGSWFYYQDVGSEALLVSSPNLDGAATLTLDHIPVGFVVMARVNVYGNDAGQETWLYIHPLDVTSESPSRTAAPLSTFATRPSGEMGATIDILTSDSAQIGIWGEDGAAGDVAEVLLATIGWYDFLGDDD